LHKPILPIKAPWHARLSVLSMKRELLAASKRAMRAKSDAALSDAIRSVEFWTEKIKEKEE